MGSGCAVCSKTIISNKWPNENESIEIIGVIDTNLGVNFIGNVDSYFVTTKKSNSNFIDNKDFFENGFVKDELMNLNKLIYNENIPEFILNNELEIPNGYQYVELDFYGNNMVFLMPDEIAKNNNINEINIHKVSCKCNQGTGCKKGSMLGAVYCDAAGCTSCSLIDNPN